MVEKLSVLVDGGKATPGPPLGPALGPLGLNIVEIIKAINEKTKSFEGMKVPVTLLVDPKSKAFTIEVGTPPTSALIAKELKVEKGSGDPGKTRVGNLSLAQAIKVANMKADAMQAKSLKTRVLEVVGTCVSMGVTVEGKPAKEFSKEIQAGKYDKQLAGYVSGPLETPSAPEPSAATGLGASPRAGSGRSPCRRPTAPGACPP